MPDQHPDTLTEIFKSEYSKLIAVLSNYYGISDLQLAEDIVSDTFIKAMKSWSHKGVPQNPRAWLRKVAQNLYYEHIRREKTFEEKIRPEFSNKEITVPSLEITDQLIEDSQLRMIFILCDPQLATDAQLCMALRILCGFTTDEISNALLSNKEAVNKKLYRAKKELRGSLSLEKELTSEDYQKRLDTVLRVIYLIFNEGYYSASEDKTIRNELCWEAMRLGLFLSKQILFPVERVNALVALMCFHASRLGARQAGVNGDLLYDKQDQTKWDHGLIKKGHHYLNLASKGQLVTKYHLEAAIAFWHTNEHDDKWQQILMLYNKLLTMEYSPIIAMNRTYALAKAQSPDKGIEEALKLGLNEDVHLHCLLAELHRMNESIDLEIKYLRLAFKLAKKENEKNVIQEKLEKAFDTNP